mmetsp:Transcript_4465/g.6924  ORF Transcript_4465/g.6924 Transcript_4465/m.6924 type:complete len:92 (+) Transcript_4465:1311-1586(+)
MSSLTTKTVQLPADTLEIGFGKGPGGRAMVVGVDPSSKVAGMLNVGDIVVALEENGSVTYNNPRLYDLVEMIRDEENNPFRKITVVESDYS